LDKAPFLDRFTYFIQTNNRARYWYVPVIAVVGLVIGILSLISIWLSLVLVLGVIFVVVALQKPIIFCYFLIAVVTLTSGIPRGTIVPMFSLNELALVLTLAITVVYAVISRRPVLNPGYGFTSFILLICGGVILPIAAYLYQGVELTIDNSFSLFTAIQYFLIFWIFQTIPENNRERLNLIYFMILCAVIVAIVGILQMLGVSFINQFLASYYPSSHGLVAMETMRVTSLLGAWNAMGMFLMMNLVLSWAVLNSKTQINNRMLLIVSMILILICLILTGSYAGLLTLVVGITLSEIFSKSRLQNLPKNMTRISLILLVVIMLQPVLLPVISNRIAFQSRYGGILPETLVFRFEVWEKVFMPPIREAFPWAVAPTVPLTYAWLFPESQYVLLQFTTGLIGLASFIGWVMLSLVYLQSRRANTTGFPNMVVSTTMIVIILLTLAGLTNAVFTYSGVSEYLWILLAFSTSPMEVSNDPT
jgi:hypothetical protein